VSVVAGLFLLLLAAVALAQVSADLDYGDAPEYDPERPASQVLYTGHHDLLPMFPTTVSYVGDDWYVSHSEPFSEVFLGEVASAEAVAEVVDKDDDDGLLTRTLAPSETQGIELLITIPTDASPDTPMYLNGLFDWSQNGAWAGSVNVDGTEVPEWAIQDLRLDEPPYNLSEPGIYQITVPVTAGWGGNVWARFSVTTEPVPVSEEDGEWHGQGQFVSGETEDWIIRIKKNHKGLPPSGPVTTVSDDPLPPGQRKDKSKEIKKGNNGVGNGVDPQPPGNPPINDDFGTGPGNPGNRGGPEDKDGKGQGGQGGGQGQDEGQGQGQGQGKGKGKGKGKDK